MDVTLYGTPTCPYCHMARELLNQKGIKFKDIDVSADQAAAAQMVKASGQRGVPVIIIDGKIIVGFDKPEIEAALAGKKNAGPATEIYR